MVRSGAYVFGGALLCFSVVRSGADVLPRFSVFLSGAYVLGLPQLCAPALSALVVWCVAWVVLWSVCLLGCVLLFVGAPVVSLSGLMVHEFVAASFGVEPRVYVWCCLPLVVACSFVGVVGVRAGVALAPSLSCFWSRPVCAPETFGLEKVPSEILW